MLIKRLKIQYEQSYFIFKSRDNMNNDRFSFIDTHYFKALSIS